MKRRTDILTHLLLLLLLLVACTADDAIKENLSHQDEYVTVRMHIPGMKAVATRAAETDNITSIVALVFRSNQLISVTEYSTTNSALHPISPISGTITIEKPTNGDVIHFLANLPANYSEGVTYVDYLKGFITNQNKTQEDVLRNLSSRDYDKLSYWGMATRNENNAVMDVMLYRNKAMIEIKPGADCTFRQDELFIAGLDNPNNVGLLVPYNGGFNFDLDNNDYQTLPADPDPLDKTDELTNYGAGYDNAYYVFEHENPNNENGLYVICKIGDDYYKVALHDEKGQPYHIIRNHKYTILVNDLDAGCETYSEALLADPIKPTVIETTTMSATSGTIDIGQEQTSTIITLTKPTDITSINITFDSSYFEIVGSFDGNNGNYWVHSNNNATTDFTFQVKSGTPTGDYTITFTGQYSGQSVSTTATITVVNNSAPGGDEPSLPGDVIWSGSQEIDWGKDGGLSFTLDASKFSACYGKIIGLDFVRTEGKDSYQMQLKVRDSADNEMLYNDKTSIQDDRVTMELDLINTQLPLPDSCYLYINGVGLTLKKIYIKQAN